MKSVIPFPRRIASALACSKQVVDSHLGSSPFTNSRMLPYDGLRRSPFFALACCLAMSQMGFMPAAKAAVVSGRARNPQLSVNSSNLTFNNIPVGTTTTQTLTLSSTGTSSVRVNSDAISGSGFKVVSQALPATLKPKQTLTLQVQFDPTTSGTSNGQLTISSNANNGGTIVVALRGTGSSSSPQLALSTTALSFGNVAANVATTRSLTLQSTGTTPVVVTSAAVAGAGFSTVGGSFPITLNPAQTAPLQVQFKAATAGPATGQLQISSNSSSGSSVVVALSAAVDATTHQMALSWLAPNSSSDAVTGYNVYRATGSGALTLIHSSPDASTTYVDSTVLGGTSYNYVVKSVDSHNVESAASNAFQVTIP